MIFFQNSGTARVLSNVSEVNNVARNSIENLLTSIVERLPYIAAGFVVLVVFLLAAKLSRYIFWTTSSKTRLDYRLRILFARLIWLSMLFLGIFTALTVIIPTLRFGDLIAGFGFTSFIIGFATKDILNNLLSGVLILWHQPFKIGDYIFIGNNQGKVENIGVRATQLRKDDGERVLIPNGDMYSNALTIRGAGAERRMNLSLAIGFDSDIAQAKEIIRSVLTDTDGVATEPKPNVVVTDLTSDGVNISVYFWVDTDKQRPAVVFDNVATEVKKRLSEASVEIFPPSSVIVQTVANPPIDENSSPKKDDNII